MKNKNFNNLLIRHIYILPISCIIIIFQSCCSYSTVPEIRNKIFDNYYSHIILNYSVHIGASKKEKEVVKKSINDMRLKDIKEVSIMPKYGLFLQINITHAEDNRVRPGIAWITYLTAGIIPTYTLNADYYIFNYYLYYNTKLILKKEYKIISKSFNWLFSVPFRFGPRGNYYRMGKIIDFINHDFFQLCKECL